MGLKSELWPLMTRGSFPPHHGVPGQGGGYKNMVAVIEDIIRQAAGDEPQGDLSEVADSRKMTF
jgi:hypothetical protein